MKSAIASVRLIALSLVISVALIAQTNVLTQHNDMGRTGRNTTETILTPDNVSSGNFGRLYSVPLDGQAYAQPLYMSSVQMGAKSYSVVFVATEHDSVYALDSNNDGATLWQASLLDTAHGASTGATTDPESDTGCPDVDGPEYGIMGTPVIDPTTNTLYVVSLTYENDYPVQRLHALDVTSGNEKFGGPVTIQATVPGTGAGSSNGYVSFDPKWSNQRPGLLLLNGNVYISWAAHCDDSPWHGWVMGYNAATLAQTGVLVTTPNGTAGGIWMSGAGLAADNVGSSAPRMFVPTGNGSFDSNGDYGDSILRLNLLNGIQVADSFTPSNEDALNNADADLGAGGVMVLPDDLPGSAYAHLALQLGKPPIFSDPNATMFLFNRDSLGGYNASGNNVVAQVGALPGLWGTPSFWNNNIYFWGYNDALRQYSLTFNNGQPQLMLTATSHDNEYSPENTNHFLGSTSSISSNGSSNGIVWTDDWRSGGQTSLLTQVLYAHDAANVSTTLWSSAQNADRDSAGPAQKWAVPTVADGKVFLAANDQLNVYGLLTQSQNVSGLRYVPVAPCRVADTRNSEGPFGGPLLQGGTSREFTIPNSNCGIPVYAHAYSLNITVVPTINLGYLQIWPDGQSQPNTSLLNSDDGRVKANSVIIPAGTNGGVDLYATNDTQVVIDINGYFVSSSNNSGLQFYPISPCRAFDTRLEGQGPALTASQVSNFAVGGTCGLPSTAQAYSLNLTAVPSKTALGYLTAWPTGQNQPATSNLNSPTGQVVANAAIVQAGTNGSISVLATNETDLVIDVNGYFGPAGSGGLSLYPVSSCRAQDTRLNGAGTAVSGILNVPIGGSPCAPPATAQAYVFNATVVPSQPLGYLTLWPNGLPLPTISILNSNDASVTSNMAIIGTSNGNIDAYLPDLSQLILDLNSYFAP